MRRAPLSVPWAKNAWSVSSFATQCASHVKHFRRCRTCTERILGGDGGDGLPSVVLQKGSQHSYFIHVRRDCAHECRVQCCNDGDMNRLIAHVHRLGRTAHLSPRARDSTSSMMTALRPARLQSSWQPATRHCVSSFTIRTVHLHNKRCHDSYLFKAPIIATDDPFVMASYADLTPRLGSLRSSTNDTPA